jgi:hypothetical protein
MYACSPEWKADWISENGLREFLSVLSGKILPAPRGKESIGLSHGLHFTGGEPFLNYDLLLKATEMSEEFSIPSTFVETNCSWCTNDDLTREKLKSLRDAGLKGIMISVNPFYAEYIPFERTERCIHLSMEVFGHNVFVYQFEYYSRFKELGIRRRISLKEYLELSSHESLTQNVELFLMGRANEALKDFYPAYPAQNFFSYPCSPPFLRDWHNHFDNYGNFMPGFCGGISLGHWRDIDRMLNDGIDLDEHPVLAFLCREDMEGLYRFASDHGFKESQDGYLSKCHVCLDIRKHLVSTGHYPELQPREFYDHIGEFQNP